jgi:hypothetical protein
MVEIPIERKATQEGGGGDGLEAKPKGNDKWTEAKSQDFFH